MAQILWPPLLKMKCRWPALAMAMAFVENASLKSALNPQKAYQEALEKPFFKKNTLGMNSKELVAKLSCTATLLFKVPIGKNHHADKASCEAFKVKTLVD